MLSEDTGRDRAASSLASALARKERLLPSSVWSEFFDASGPPEEFLQNRQGPEVPECRKSQ